MSGLGFDLKMFVVLCFSVCVCVFGVCVCVGCCCYELLFIVYVTVLYVFLIALLLFFRIVSCSACAWALSFWFVFPRGQG